MNRYKFDELIQVDGVPMTKHHIHSLSFEQREQLIEPIVEILKASEFPLPDDPCDLQKEWKRLLDVQVDTSVDDAYNNSSVATEICKYFCAVKFYGTTEPGKRNMYELWKDETVLRSLVRNRLGMNWYHPHTSKDGTVVPGVNEAFNLYMKMFIQGMRSMRLISQVSMFKPDIAKLLVTKYSQPGDVVYDYSCGFGGRMLGTVAAGRRYIGTDPYTTPELELMREHLQITEENARLINSGSEHRVLPEDSVDFAFSSPPYMIQKKGVYVPVEEYSREGQAYSQGEDYFYNVYWKQTLENCKSYLKPGKWFGLNVFEKESKMIETARNVFGEEKEVFKLRTVKSHLAGKSKELNNTQKWEPVYMFINEK